MKQTLNEAGSLKIPTDTKQVNGVIIVDKPEGISSAGLVERVKRLSGAGKVGHAGTLDPFATGVMICLLNRATRLAPFFLHADKTYRATLYLGVETDTQDGTGKITARHPVCAHDFPDTDILRACKSFEGESLQTPPAFSAIKHRGTPLYKLARRGVTVEKPARQIIISSIHVERIDLPRVSFHVASSGGTYIRTLAADIGTSLGCGAHLESLRRTVACGFTLAEAIPLDALELSTQENGPALKTISMNQALRQIPACPVDAVLADQIRHGRTITPQDLTTEPRTDSRGYVKMVTGRGDLLAVMEKKSDAFVYCCAFPEEGLCNL